MSNNNDDGLSEIAAAIEFAGDYAPIINDRDLADHPRNDYGNAQRLIQRHGRDLIHVDEAGWFVWDGRRFNSEPSQKFPESQKRAHLTALAILAEAEALVPELRALRTDLKAIKAERDRLTAIAGAKTETVAELDGRISDLQVLVALAEERLGVHRKFATSSGNSPRIAAMLKEAEPYLRKGPRDLDADGFKFNAGNGCVILGPRQADGAVDIRFRPHLRGDVMTHLSPVAYDPAAACPLFRKFLADIQPSEQIRRFLQCYGGYGMTGDVGEQVMVLFHGRGANGKSTYLNVLQHVLGDYALTLPIQTFLHNDNRGAGDATPDLARLPGARLVMASEPEKGARLSEAVVKTVTGADKVVARRLFQGQFEFEPTFKLLLSANEKPRITGQDEGIWRRVILVPFNEFIPRARRNHRLLAELKEEAPGILNWLLDGYRLWRDQGLEIPLELQAATDRYRQESDPVGEFMRGCTEKAPAGSIQARALYEVYVEWCRDNAQSEWRNTGFGRRLSDMGYEKEKSGSLYYVGIDWSATGKALFDRVNLARERKQHGAAGRAAGEAGEPSPRPVDEDL